MAENENRGNIGMERLLSTDLNKITKTFIEEMFASYHDKSTGEFKPAPFSPTDVITLTQAKYPYVKGSVRTTLGTLLFNRYLLERTGFIQHTGYWNEEIDEDHLGALNTAINNLIIMDKMTTQDLANYIDSRDRLGFWCSSFLGASISVGLIRPMANVEKRKAELFAQRREELSSNNPVTQTKAAGEIEQELIAMARENLKSDPGWDMYASGVNDMNNNYKTINIMRGAVYNNTTKKYDIVDSSLMNGVKQKDITAFANSVVAAAYPSAVGTADAGAMAKIILALLQSEKINPDVNSDCGTTSTIPFTITKKYKKYVLFRNIDVNGKMVMTDLNNIDQFVGKTVRLYSPMCCTADRICAKCAGRVFHNLNVENVGLLVTQITQKLLNLKLKAKHDLSQNAGDVPEKYIFWHKNNNFVVENSNLITKKKLKLFIPRVLEEISGFTREATYVSCMGMFPVKFYDEKDKEILSTMMIVPAVLSFNIYDDIQEDPDYYIVSYEPDALICNLGIQKSNVNVEFFINQIYLNSKSPQLPYLLMTEMMFRCQEINGIDLTGPSITYELLARRVCRYGEKSFAYAYGKNKEVNQLSYEKLRYRDAVQDAGVLQGILFQDVSKSMNKGLAATLNGKEPVQTPLEKIMKA